MKKIFLAGLVFVFALCFGSSVMAASYSYTWTSQSTPTSVMNSISALSPKVGLAAGVEFMEGTSTYGVSWGSTAESGTTNDIMFYSTTAGVFVGLNSKAKTITYDTTTGQFSFNQFAPAFSATLASASLQGVSFVNATNGWVCGSNSGAGIIYNWNGVGWTDQSPAGVTSFSKIAFADVNNGYAVGAKAGNKTVYVTTNGGGAWTESTVTGAGSGSFNGLQVVSATEIWVVGDAGKVFHSTNSGASWTDLSVSTTGTLYAVHFISASDGWVVGDSGAIYHTTNGGASWSAESGIDSSYNIVGLTFSGLYAGWAVGKKADNSGSIIYRNIVTPVASSISPASVIGTTDASGFTTIVTLEGDRFYGTVDSTTDTPTVAFSRGGLPVTSEVSVQQVRFLSTTKLQLTIKIYSTAGGAYDVIAQNGDTGNVTASNVLTILPPYLSVQELKIEGLSVLNGAVSTTLKAVGGPNVHFYASSPTSLSGVTVTGEVTIGSTTDALTANNFTILGNIASVESYLFSTTLEAGSYAGRINVFTSNLSTSESFTLTVAAAPIDTSNKYAVQNVVVGTSTVAQGENLVLQFNTELTADQLANAQAVIVASSPGDIYTLKVIPQASRNSAGLSAAQVSHSAKVTIVLPSELPRGVYGVFLRDATGKRISGMSRFAKAAHN